MADYYSQLYYQEQAQRKFKDKAHPQAAKDRRTEETLSSTCWIAGDGRRILIEDMDKDHLRNVLQYLYKRRDFYWLNCENADVIQMFKNADEFFEVVILESTLWNAIIKALATDRHTFNFPIKYPLGGRA